MPMYMLRQSADFSNAEMLGHVPNVASVNIELLNSEEIVNTDWQVFPLSYGGSDATVATESGLWGVAYRQVP